MTGLKYFAGIRALQEEDEKRADGPLPPFNFAGLGNPGRFAQFASRFLLRRLLPAVTAILRTAWPNPRFGRFVLVTRRQDVAEVLSDMKRFPVVYRLEMEELGDGTNNVLGLDGDEHDALLAKLRRALRPNDLYNVRGWVTEDAEALLDAGGGRIDVMRDLVTRTATEAACRLFGITANDPERFAEWTMAVSNQLFGDFFGDRNIRTQAQTAAAHLRATIDDTIARVHKRKRAREERDEGGEGDDCPEACERREAEDDGRAERGSTLIERLIVDEKMAPAEVRATILGLVTAFVPTNSLAAGNMLEVLKSRPAMWHQARKAARADDEAGLRSILLEAGRINPALAPGLWRHVPEDGEESLIGAGRRGARKVQPGDLILACIPSALRDGSGSGEAPAWMMFGYGPHICWGAELALAHLTSVFGALLKREDLDWASGKHGRMLRVSAFPVRLDMTYRDDAHRRSSMILTFDVRRGVEQREVEDALNRLGNPANETVSNSFDQVGRVQFASLSVIERGDGSSDSVLILEIRGDGEDDELLDQIADRCASWLRPLLAFCTPDGQPSSADALPTMLRQAHRPLHRWPWGPTGLHFDGLPELAVSDIERQQKVANFASGLIQEALTRDLGLSSRAMDLLLRTRRLMKRDNFDALRQRQWLESMPKPKRASILKPSRKRLALADWDWAANPYAPLRPMLLAPGNRPLLIVLAALFAGWSAVLIAWLLPSAMAVLLPFAIAASLIGGALFMILTVGLAAGLFFLLIRWRETKEPSDDRPPALEHVEKVSKREDSPGHAQNHILAVMPFKKGLIRRLSFAFVMWGILQAVLYWFRPGFVVSMGTIHKACWFRVPGTNQFVFFSNFDGSWENYLEDFITRAHEGQSAAWSHGVGFPQTRFLIGGGAEDGDRFKRWVRRQQRETRCWYSRFPDLTAQQIRRNAMIEDGLARAVSDTDARRWLSLFGSEQRERDELETQEAQTLIFSGFGKQSEATALFLTLPTEPAATSAWLEAVTGLRAQPQSALVGPPHRWVHTRCDGTTYIKLPPEARVSFGEWRIDEGGAALGFTASGLGRMGLDRKCGIGSFPAAFRMGMARRWRTLGDDPATQADWRTHDDSKQEGAAQAVLIAYGREPGLTHSDLATGHQQLLLHFGGSIEHAVPCSPVRHGTKERPYIEHFGFRDGISQPVIRGTRRAAAPVPERDLVPAGEFLLGYRNLQGFVSPPIVVGAEHDPGNDLPTPDAAESNRYPYFGMREASAGFRDFGRNGCFVAIRELDQDAPGFRQSVTCAAAALKRDYPDLAELAGGAVSADWLAAKIIGRWRDGSPLVGNADCPAGLSSKGNPDNDFSYGVDDPRGLACPLGSHVRRANPRDSQEPGDPDEQRITNRHRLLRRGRTYDYRANGDRRTGLLFVALCADLERQFEFVQRSWLNATSFHGLVDEIDPLLGRPAPAKDEALARPRRFGFTIPTAAGPVRVPAFETHVTMRGGGYFFLPSRSAIAFLINRSAVQHLRPEGR